MPAWQGTRTVSVVTACMTESGLPAFALSEVPVTQAEAENGAHLALAEAQLLAAGYEEPFVHFPEDEAPAFLHPAVRRHLGLPPAPEPIILAFPEKR